VDLSTASREEVMDRNPITYELMSKELVREGKLREFGTVQGENISDIRNYAYVDYKASYRTSAFAVNITLKNGRSYSSTLGRIDYAISRPGWVRTTVELPPGTKVSDMEAIGFQCIVAPPAKQGEALAHSGTCTLERVSKMFFLDVQYRPGKSLLHLEKPVTIPAGQSILLRP
jgi:hypothetical protein